MGFNVRTAPFSNTPTLKCKLQELRSTIVSIMLVNLLHSQLRGSKAHILWIVII